MNKKKKRCILVGILIIICILFSFLLYLFFYKFNKNEIVLFNNKLKMNIESNFAVYDTGLDDIVGSVDLICKFDGGEENLEGKFNISGDVFPTINIELQGGKNSTYKVYEDYICVYISDPYFSYGDEENVIPEIGEYGFRIYIDRNDMSKYMVKVSKSNEECNYILVCAKDGVDAKNIIKDIFTLLEKES